MFVYVFLCLMRNQSFAQSVREILSSSSTKKLENWPKLANQRLPKKAHMFEGHDGYVHNIHNALSMYVTQLHKKYPSLIFWTFQPDHSVGGHGWPAASILIGIHWWNRTRVGRSTRKGAVQNGRVHRRLVQPLRARRKWYWRRHINHQRTKTVRLCSWF